MGMGCSFSMRSLAESTQRVVVQPTQLSNPESSKQLSLACGASLPETGGATASTQPATVDNTQSEKHGQTSGKRAMGDTTVSPASAQDAKATDVAVDTTADAAANAAADAATDAAANAVAEAATNSAANAAAEAATNSAANVASNADDSSGSEGSEQVEKPARVLKKERRVGVSSGRDSTLDITWIPPNFPKTEEERASLKRMLRYSKDGKMHLLFGLVSNHTIERVIDAFDCKKVAEGESVISQGAVGDFFYVVKSGFFEIFVKKQDTPAKKVWEAGEGFAFGELALLYNAPRTATITASTESVVWQLDRASFRQLVVSAQKMKMEEHHNFLLKCEIFQSLNRVEIMQLTELLREEDFDTDEAIVEQGEHDDKMFILESGGAVACIAGEKGEIEVKRYMPGEYFGEIALLHAEPRKASVYATMPSTCLYIDRHIFRRVLGPIEDILRRTADKYPKYEVYLKDETVQKRKSAPLDDDESGNEGDKTPEPKVRKRRLRKREEDEPVPETFADKLDKDFARPILVKPSAQFIVPDVKFHLFGLTQRDQQFTDSLPSQANIEARSVADGITSYFYTNSAYGLKSPPVCAAFCQKGVKPGFGPMPNQDNVFLLTKNGVDIYGVCDGHGPFGHLISFRVVQTFPYFLTRHADFDQDKSAALHAAFTEAQTDLRQFSKDEKLNFEASGTTCSVLILEGQKIHIATLGDSRIMISSYNRHDSRVISISEDHKPENPEEKARIEAHDPPGEVREGRIYIKGETYPGLTMSRALGDFICADRGVTQVPNYECITMQPGDEWYAVVASDGIWEFMDGDTVTKISAKKLRLKGVCETLRFVIAAARRRWEHLEGDYCDDISGIIIQWNSKDKTAETGFKHCVHVETAG